MKCWGFRCMAVVVFVMLASVLLLAGCQPADTKYSNKLPPEVITALLNSDPPQKTEFNMHAPCHNPYVPYLSSPTPPPDDASPESMVGWWAGEHAFINDLLPSEKARQRMLDLLLERPEILSKNLNLLPNNPSVHDRVKAAYDREKARLDAEEPEDAESDRQWDIDLNKAVRRWLMLNSKYFRNDLIEKIKTSDPAKYSRELADDMQSLLKLDPKTGKDILLAMARQKRHYMAMLALQEYSLLPEGKDLTAVRPELRDGLIKVVEDKNAAPALRYYALKALAKDNWPGQEQWVEKLFTDPTMMEDDYQPITGLMADCRWLPLAIKLVSNPNSDIHEAAVACLMQRVDTCCETKPISKQAVMALFPWIKDPKWSKNTGRHTLLDALSEADVPECMPAVLALLKNGGNDDIVFIAFAVAKYKDVSAVPLLKESLAKCRDNKIRGTIVSALCDLGAYTIEQQTQALTGEFKGDLGPTSMPTSEPGQSFDSIKSEGYLICESLRWDKNSKPALNKAKSDLTGTVDSLTDLEIYYFLFDGDAATGRAFLVEMLIKYVVPPESDISKLCKVESQEAVDEAKSTATFLNNMLKRSEKFRKDAPTELHRLRDMKGAKGAISVVMLGDTESAVQILKSDDQAAARAILAAAKSAKLKLPLNVVGSCLDGHDLKLADAAEAYLRADGSTEARRIVAAHRRGEYLIFGALQRLISEDLLLEIQGKPPRLGGFDNPIVLPGAGVQPDEIWAIMTVAPMGGARGNVIIRRRGDTAELTYSTSYGNVKWTKHLSSEQLKDLKVFLDKCHSDELPDFESRVNDGITVTFAHLTPRYARAFDMNNPQIVPFSVYDRLTEYFFQLALPAPKKTAATSPADSSPASQPATTP